MQISDGLSTSWSFTSSLDCRKAGLACSRLTLSLSQPIRLERARLSALLADTPEDYFADPTFSLREVNLEPSSRELDLGLSVTSDTRVGSFGLDLKGLVNEGHQQRDSVGYGVSGSFRRRF